jgi:phospholipid transport system substrate-binding protein
MEIVDVMAEGVSMAITFRSEFGSVIQRGNGDVRVLINELQENLERGAYEPDKVEGIVQ